MAFVYLVLFILAAIFAITLIIGAAFKLAGFALAAMLFVAAGLWISRKLRGPKPPERLTR